MRVELTKKILIYLPCYNCENTILPTLDKIPPDMRDEIECLVIDNRSEDRTSDVVAEAVKQKRYSFPVYLVQPETNVGYAGSQKLAYSIALSNPCVKQVIMLHGDGQYPVELITQYRPYFEGEQGIVNGCRSKRAFPEKEETPLSTYLVIKLLSGMESLLLMIPQKEWHSGFVMYSTDFLRKIPLERLSTTMHIDGEFLMCAHILKEKTVAVPIYKKYKALTALERNKQIEHVMNVFKLIAKYWRGYYRDLLLKRDPAQSFTVKYDVVTKG